jgi:hypothetical protein
MKSTIFWVITLCSLVQSIGILKENIALAFMDEDKAKQEIGNKQVT